MHILWVQVFFTIGLGGCHVVICVMDIHIVIAADVVADDGRPVFQSVDTHDVVVFAGDDIFHDHFLDFFFCNICLIEESDDIACIRMLHEPGCASGPDEVAVIAAVI